MINEKLLTVNCDCSEIVAIKYLRVKLYVGVLQNVVRSSEIKRKGKTAVYV